MSGWPDLPLVTRRTNATLLYTVRSICAGEKQLGLAGGEKNKPFGIRSVLSFCLKSSSTPPPLRENHFFFFLHVCLIWESTRQKANSDSRFVCYRLTRTMTHGSYGWHLQGAPPLVASPRRPAITFIAQPRKYAVIMRFDSSDRTLAFLARSGNAR